MSETVALNRRVLLSTLVAFKSEDFSVRLPVDLTELDGKIR